MSLPPTPAHLFDHRCRTTLQIACSKERLYRALHAVAEWPRYLPHVLAIELLYDDGQYQEFYMTVASNGSSLRVRSVRNCQEEGIEFFQPEPPAFLRHHAGRWEIQTLTPNSCAVTVTHLWNLEPVVAAESFPPAPDQSTEAQVAALLHAHSRLALARWQQVLAPATGSTP